MSSSRTQAQAAKPKAFLVVTFDVEDYISPESEHIDDIPKWLAQIMTEEGVTGTFFVIGEKARSLEKRGRRDVIEAMAKHDIGSHTNFGSIHPTVTEELEKADWSGGVQKMLEQESAGIRELKRIFGVPVTILARHGGSYGPQLVNALGHMRVAYQGSPARLPGHDVVWFCNALNFSAQYAGFDDAYYRDDLFEPVFEKLKADLPKLAQTTDGHRPLRRPSDQDPGRGVLGPQFLLRQEHGAGRVGHAAPPPAETMATAQKNFRRMMRWLKGRDDIQITNYRTLVDMYSGHVDYIGPLFLADMAEAALKTKSLAPLGEFSPAEAFSGLAWSICGIARTGVPPQSVKSGHPLGPMEMPPAQPEIARVKLEDVFRLAAEAVEVIDRTGALPASLSVGKARIGAGSLFALFSAVYLDAGSDKLRPEYDVPAFEPYPQDERGGHHQGGRGLQDLAGPPPRPRHVQDRRVHEAPALDAQAGDPFDKPGRSDTRGREFAARSSKTVSKMARTLSSVTRSSMLMQQTPVR